MMRLRASAKSDQLSGADQIFQPALDAREGNPFHGVS
jgi:hypothetical protein